MSDDIVLKISNVSKSFGAIQALREVDFELRRGEVHAIAGENGAGKSTLMNIIDGILRPDSGEIRLNGEPVEITSPARAQELGIGFVHQEIALCPDVTVAENIFMAEINASRKWLMNYPDLFARAREALAQLSPIDPTVLVKTLSISQQQLVEIAKALTLDCRILILDEPTAALTEREARVLFGIMRSSPPAASRSSTSRTAWSRSSTTATGSRSSATDAASRPPRWPRSPRTTSSTTWSAASSASSTRRSRARRSGCPDALMEVRGLTDRRRFRDVAFDAPAGRDPRHRRPDRRRPERDRQGHLRPPRGHERRGDPRRQAASPSAATATASTTASSTSRRTARATASSSTCRSPPMSRRIDLRQVSTPWGTIDAEKEAEQANRLGDRLGLKRGGIDDPVSSLSGGNQQKVAIAKMLSVNPRVIFLDEPTRGVDVGAKAEIHRILRDLARNGVGIVVVSSELPELIGLCDRVLVVREGVISGDGRGRRADRGKHHAPRLVHRARGPGHRRATHRRHSIERGRASASATSRWHGPPDAAPRSAGSCGCARPGSILVILLLFAVMSFASPYFLTWENMRAMTMAFAVEGIVVVGMTILLISGGIDLSVGSVVAFAMVLAGWLFLAGRRSVARLGARDPRLRRHRRGDGLLRHPDRPPSLHRVARLHGDRARRLPALHAGPAARPFHPAAGVQVHRPGIDRRHPLRHHHLRGLRHRLRLPAPPLDRLPQGLLHGQQREGGRLFRHPHQAGDLLHHRALLDARGLRRHHLHGALRLGPADLRHRHGAQRHRRGGDRRGQPLGRPGHHPRRHPRRGAALGGLELARAPRRLGLLAGHHPRLDPARRGRRSTITFTGARRCEGIDADIERLPPLRGRAADLQRAGDALPGGHHRRPRSPSSPSSRTPRSTG